MFMNRNFFLFIVFCLSIPFFKIISAEKDPEIGILEKYGNTLPLELTFTNSDNKQVQLKNIINKPTVLVFVYYHCQHVCTPLLDDLTELLDKSDLVAGKDFQIVTISFNHEETVADAAKWKSKYLGNLQHKIDPSAWEFMVGDSISIKKITSEAGFFFRKDSTKDFNHPTSLIILSSDGKIARYMLGNGYLPADFKMAINEAKEGKSVPTIRKLIRFCFSYDKKDNKLVLNYNRVFGIAVILVIGIFFVTLLIKNKKKE